jgi:hypothetical protein
MSGLTQIDPLPSTSRTTGAAALRRHKPGIPLRALHRERRRRRIGEAVLGSPDIPEVAITSSTAPGVIHRWTNLEAFASEIAEARICVGLHYRFSTRVGTEMGHKIGAYVAANILQPVDVARQIRHWSARRKIRLSCRPRTA